ncbi:hypothetical protein RHECIAT_CH0001888 [Rhizobium etli CIAT 652]|uniref:Uncharacterized protein n=2 Tax=Rhizobium/Agrobacterium group TaxID=227290 RepID=B3PXS1_RHIE6|nr:hypothetical protein RHECIAT_CH0001888 [Rhizobium etli CIAT 652]
MGSGNSPDFLGGSRGSVTAEMGETSMNRFRLFAAAGAITLAAIASACSTAPNSYGSASSYQPGDSMNPACADGFRPGDGRSCSY